MTLVMDEEEVLLFVLYKHILVKFSLPGTSTQLKGEKVYLIRGRLAPKAEASW